MSDRDFQAPPDVPVQRMNANAEFLDYTEDEEEEDFNDFVMPVGPQTPPESLSSRSITTRSKVRTFPNMLNIGILRSENNFLARKMDF